jgi:hypothetical protein
LVSLPIAIPTKSTTTNAMPIMPTSVED